MRFLAYGACAFDGNGFYELRCTVQNRYIKSRYASLRSEKCRTNILAQFFTGGEKTSCFCYRHRRRSAFFIGDTACMDGRLLMSSHRACQLYCPCTEFVAKDDNASDWTTNTRDSGSLVPARLGYMRKLVYPWFSLMSTWNFFEFLKAVPLFSGTLVC